MRRLLRFLLPSWGWVLLAVLLGALTVTAGIGLLGTSAWLISAAALQPPIAALQIAIVGVRFFGIARSVLRYLERLVSHNTTFRLLGRIRVWFYEAVEPLAPAGLSRMRSGDLLTRSLADIESLENLYVRALAPPLVAGVVICGVCLWIGSFDVVPGLALLAALLLVGAVLPAAHILLGRKPGRELVESRACLRAEIVDAVQGMPELLVYDGMPAQMERVRQSSAALQRAQRRMAWIGSVGSALTTLFTHLGVLALLVLSIPLVNSGRIDGVYLAVILLGGLASFESVQGLPQAAQYLESNLAAARRLFEIADASPTVHAPEKPLPIPRTTGISACELTFSFDAGGPPVLSGISFELPAGKHLAVVGPSGAGKSTLVDLLLRFQDCPPGSLLLGGEDIRKFDPEAVRNCFSTMLQETCLFQASLRENLMMADPQADESRLEQVIEAAGLAEFTAGLPDGLDTRIGEQGKLLSGGERQRASLARSLLRQEAIHIFDEPTANLDAVTERGVIDACFHALQGRSLLWITHRLVGLEAMDEILVLDAGRIVQRGRHDELVQADGLYRQMWELQNRFIAEA